MTRAKTTRGLDSNPHRPLRTSKLCGCWRPSNPVMRIRLLLKPGGGSGWDLPTQGSGSPPRGGGTLQKKPVADPEGGNTQTMPGHKYKATLDWPEGKADIRTASKPLRSEKVAVSKFLCEWRIEGWTHKHNVLQKKRLCETNNFWDKPRTKQAVARYDLSRKINRAQT